MNLIFVYNANSGLLPLLKDFGHKIISPKTYPCSLCALTYDTYKENERWKKFRKTESNDFKFLHKDEFHSEYPNVEFNLPVILKYDDVGLSELISAQELNKFSNIDELILRLKALI